MRILMFTGKEGVGKTSLAAATGVKLAALIVSSNFIEDVLRVVPLLEHSFNPIILPF